MGRGGEGRGGRRGEGRGGRGGVYATYGPVSGSKSIPLPPNIPVEAELQRLRDTMDQLQSENEHKAHLIAELNHTPKPKSGLPVSPTSPPYPGGDAEGGRSPAEDGSFSRQSGERKSFRQRMSKAFSRWGVSGGGDCQGVGTVRGWGVSGGGVCQGVGTVRGWGVSGGGGCQGVGVSGCVCVCR